MPISLVPPFLDVPPPVAVRRFTVEEYHQLISTGILGEDDPCELLEGYIVPKMSRNPPHDLCLVLLHTVLAKILPHGWFLRGQSPVTTADSEPEPDLAVVRGDPRDFRARHPGPADMGLVVEVADSSLERDESFKARLYARASVAVYWIVNIPDNLLEVYTHPTGPADEPHFRTRRDFRPDENVSLILDRATVGTVLVRDVLP